MTVTVKSKMPIVVPPSVRRLAGFKSGNKLEFKVSGGIVSIFPKRDSGDTLTPEEAKIVRRGEAQLRRGDSKPWRAVKHALAR
jgi:bifunctional DNA-binding transcriptional regulator/antitoxin component of YhaV-PrlF toxin-antitoxin module